MKRHIQIFAAVLAMMSAAGCSGMLDDIAPRHAISSDKLSDSDLNQLTNGMLNMMESYTRDLWFTGDYLGENFKGGPGAVPRTDWSSDLAQSTSALAETEWNASFTKLLYANELIAAAQKSVNQGSETVTDAYGTGYFCRAFIYLNLAERYGNVPIIKGTTNDVIAISPESDVWQFVLDNCTDAIANLRSYYDRYYPSKEAAYLLYAKANLWIAAIADRSGGSYLGKQASDYRSVAADYAGRVIGNTGFSMSSTSEDFAGMFINGTQNPEIVFALANNRPTAFIRLFEQINDTDGSFNYSPADDMYSGLFGDDGYRTGDIRKNPTFSSTDASRTIKLPNGRDGQFITNPDAQTSPMMVFRLADAYLLKAEAEGAATGLATMEEFMEKRYASVSLPASMTDEEFRTLLLDENNREFYAEGRRWFDIKRLYLSDVSTAKPFKGGFNDWAEEHSFLWPVPQNQIDIAGETAYPQNPEY